MEELNGHYRKSDIKIAVIEENINKILNDMSEIKSDIKTISKCFDEHRLEAEGRNSQIKSLNGNVKVQWWFIAFLIVIILGEVVRGLFR